MTPRRLDPDSISARLQLLEPLVARLAGLVGVTGDDLQEDLDRRLVVERILTVLVDTAVAVNGHIASATGGQVPEGYRSSFAAAAKAGAITDDLAARLAPSAGLRNLLTHRYGEVDLYIVAAAIPQAHDDFTEYLVQVSSWLAVQSGP